MSDELGELPDSWSWVTLADVLAEPLVNGRSVKTMDGGFPVLRLTAISGGNIDLGESKEGAWTAEQAGPFLVQHGDFLLSRGNGSKRLVGRGGLVKDVARQVAFPDTMIRVRLAQELMSSSYFQFLWESPLVRMQVEARARTTAGIYKVNQAILESVVLPLPPLAEQLRIVEALEEQLSRLDAAERAVARVLRRQVLLAGIVRDHIVRAEGELPEGWARRSLRDVVRRVEAGKSFRCDPQPAADGEWGVIKVSAMTWGEFRPEEQKAVPIDRPIDARHEISAGDILVSRANTPEYVGAPVLVRKTRSRLLLSDKSLRLVPATGVSRDWLITVLSAPLVRRQISAKATGSKDSMRNISQKDLLSVKIPVPPVKMQPLLAEHADEALSGIGGMAREAERALARAAKLRTAILRRAFAGQLVEQDPDDVPAFHLLDRIKAERAAQPKPKRARKTTAKPPAQRVADVTAPEPTTAPALAVQQEFEL
ncbi:restriction endonuclease subunit S [Streptomyces olivaceus]|uniref:restriction endonuclease subunit S n=1 Tax=Streptomyces TaxID=1883 RepID=UPI001FB779E0|nr:restriction endonuclease subunit S [Streptomyces sp. CB09030]UOG78768.1 restriction endonuclease subunit S [Streptomyces sp. CB09030]